MKKRLVIPLIALTIIGGTIVTDYFVDSINIYSSITSKFNNDNNLNSDLTKDNSSYFVPVDIKGKLKKTEYTGSHSIVPINYKTDIIEVPVMDGEYKYNYADTIYSAGGDFYMVISNDKTDNGVVEKVTKYEYTLGRNRPIVIEVRFPNTSSILYIQCYTPEAYGFYSDYDWNSVKYSYNDTLRMSDDEMASFALVPKEIVPEFIDMYLEDEYIDITKNFRQGADGKVTFITYNDKEVSYRRVVGYMTTHMKCEYLRLVSMGYTPIEYGHYRSVGYIKFDDFTVLVSSVTNNSCIIYYVN